MKPPEVGIQAEYQASQTRWKVLAIYSVERKIPRKVLAIYSVERKIPRKVVEIHTP